MLRALLLAASCPPPPVAGATREGLADAETATENQAAAASRAQGPAPTAFSHLCRCSRAAWFDPQGGRCPQHRFVGAQPPYPRSRTRSRNGAVRASVARR